MIRQESTTAVLRRAILAILVIVLIGTEAELFLLKHIEDYWQLVPIVLIPLTLVILAWHGLSQGRAALRALQLVMALALVSGGIGVIQHYRANLVDAAESDPSLSGKALYVKAVAGSIPALAPGTMVQIGLLGLAFAFRHPRLRTNADGLGDD
jgi:hypothetical protein